MGAAVNLPGVGLHHHVGGCCTRPADRRECILGGSLRKEYDTRKGSWCVVERGRHDEGGPAEWLGRVSP